MKRRALIIVPVLALVAGIGFSVWDSRRDLDLSNDEAPFNTIQLPLRKVEGDVFMDGGSVSVQVEDGRRISYKFKIRIDSVTKNYPSVLYYATPPSTNGVELTDPSRAKAIVLRWLEQAPVRDDGVETAEDYLSGRAHSDLGYLLIGVRRTLSNLLQ